MYIPKSFLMDESKIAQFINQYPLATLITTTEESENPIINFAPLLYDAKSHSLFGHLANNNEQLSAMAVNRSITIIFNGENGYISPNWYADKTQVPTWNFSNVKIRGKVTLIDQINDKRLLLMRLSEHFEQQINSDWSITKVPEAKLQAMLGAITGFSVKIEQWQGKAKLSQNKPQHEREKLILALNQLDNSKAESLASDMKAN